MRIVSASPAAQRRSRAPRAQWRAHRLGNASHSSVHQSPGMPRCQALGCGKDLSKAASYFRRYRVCEKHHKVSGSIRGGTRPGIDERWKREADAALERPFFGACDDGGVGGATPR